MATKKSKQSAKPNRAKTTKPKTAPKSAKKATLKAPKTEMVARNTTTKSWLSEFFARKYEEKNEGILTIFKKPKFYGALLGELLGTMLLTLLIFALWVIGIAWSQYGNGNIAIYVFAIIATLVAVYSLSGACLNPLVTVGMMATRRVSVIRGVMYIIAEILGAWLGWLIFNAFHLLGGEMAMDVPIMTAVAEDGFWPVALIELVGSIIVAFFFARALTYKRSVFTFAAVVAGGILLAFIFGFIISAAFLGLSNNFVLNPAIAVWMQIFPTAGENFGQILGGIGQALAIYAILPAIGGVLGFYLSDFAAKLSEE